MLMAGCMNGYPSEDQPRSSSLSSIDHVRALNRYVAISNGDHKPRFQLPTSCMLELSGLTSEAGSRPRRIAVESMRITLQGDKETGIFSVTISESAEGSERPVHKFAVGGWIDAVAFRSHLQHLIFACVDDPDRVAA